MPGRHEVGPEAAEYFDSGDLSDAPVQQLQVEVEVEGNLRPTVSRPGCLGVGLTSRAHDQIFVSCLTIVERPL
jgi:hypothetical protein